MAVDRERRDLIASAIAAFMRGEIGSKQYAEQMGRHLNDDGNHDFLARTASNIFAMWGGDITMSNRIAVSRAQWDQMVGWTQILQTDIDWDSDNEDAKSPPMVYAFAWPIRALFTMTAVGSIIALINGLRTAAFFWLGAGAIMAAICMTVLLTARNDPWFPFATRREREEHLANVCMPILPDYSRHMHGLTMRQRFVRVGYGYFCYSFLAIAVTVILWPFVVWGQKPKAGSGTRCAGSLMRSSLTRSPPSSR